MPTAPPPDFAAALAAGPLVLDGGMSNQLAAAGHDLSDELWSARLLADDPQAVVAAHRAYFAAGADVAITASYQASFEGFARRGSTGRRPRGCWRGAWSWPGRRRGRSRAGGGAGWRPRWVRTGRCWRTVRSTGAGTG